MDLDAAVAMTIRILNLCRNPVTTIEGAEKLGGLKQVNCYWCGLSAVPTWIGALPLLESINFGRNDIAEIPSRLLQNEKVYVDWNIGESDGDETSKYP